LVYGWSTSWLFTKLPEKAMAPLLWGGCVAGTTGTTADSGISGGSGYTYWFNANTTTNNPNIIAATGQALDELNIIMYSDNLVQNISKDGVNSVYTFWDTYPFKSVGDGLFGEEYSTVVKNLSAPYCGGWTGGFATSSIGADSEKLSESSSKNFSEGISSNKFFKPGTG
jgi:hypothetical protein